MCWAEHDIEQFEDDPLEYIRTDLSLPAASGGLGLGSHDAMTRRQAAADLLRALVSSGLEAETTEVAGAWINQGLQEYNNNRTKEDSWKSKDTAVYLLTAVATRGSTSQVSMEHHGDIVVCRILFSARCYFNECFSRCCEVLLRTYLSGFASSCWERPSLAASGCHSIPIYFPYPGKTYSATRCHRIHSAM